MSLHQHATAIPGTPVPPQSLCKSLLAFFCCCSPTFAQTHPSLEGTSAHLSSVFLYLFFLGKSTIRWNWKWFIAGIFYPQRSVKYVKSFELPPGGCTSMWMKSYKGPEQWASLPPIPHTMHCFEQRPNSKALHYIPYLIICACGYGSK